MYTIYRSITYIKLHLHDIIYNHNKVAYIDAYPNTLGVWHVRIPLIEIGGDKYISTFLDELIFPKDLNYGFDPVHCLVTLCQRIAVMIILDHRKTLGHWSNTALLAQTIINHGSTLVAPLLSL